MREIKFRAWDKQNNKMCEPDAFFIFTGSEVLLLNPHHKDTTYYKIDTQTERFVQMQFTGLKDKNGKEIYEFDHLQAGESIVEIRYSGARFEGFYLNESEKHESPLGNRNYNHWEIIGNKFENKQN